jgi:hypothetical protein
VDLPCLVDSQMLARRQPVGRRQAVSEVALKKPMAGARDAIDEIGAPITGTLRSRQDQ